MLLGLLTALFDSVHCYICLLDSRFQRSLLLIQHIDSVQHTSLNSIVTIEIWDYALMCLSLTSLSDAPVGFLQTPVFPAFSLLRQPCNRAPQGPQPDILRMTLQFPQGHVNHDDIVRVVTWSESKARGAYVMLCCPCGSTKGFP